MPHLPTTQPHLQRDFGGALLASDAFSGPCVSHRFCAAAPAARIYETSCALQAVQHVDLHILMRLAFAHPRMRDNMRLKLAPSPSRLAFESRLPLFQIPAGYSCLLREVIVIYNLTK